MRIKALTLVNFILASVLLASMLFSAMSVNTSSSVEYDPWLDINDDGKINMKDLYAEILAFGTEGDPTKNVTVTNFPTEVNVNIVPHTLSVTFAIHKTTSGEDWYTQNISGCYEQVTIGMFVWNTSVSDAHFAIYWIVGGVEVLYHSHTLLPKNHKVDTFPVQGEAIKILTRPHTGNQCTYSLGLYATD
jgi:hypothetical protein